MGLLDELLAELPKKPAKAPKRVAINMETKRASGTDLYEGQGEEGEINALTARILAEQSWHTEARVVLAIHQRCACCLNESTHIAGLFIRQSRRGVIRRTSKLHFTELDLNELPLEVEEFESVVQHCFSCLSTELLAEQILAQRGQLELSFNEASNTQAVAPPSIDKLTRELELEVLPEGSINAMLR